MDYDSRQAFRPQDLLQGHLDFLNQRKLDLETWLEKYGYPTKDTAMRQEIALCKADIEHINESILDFENATGKVV